MNAAPQHSGPFAVLRALGVSIVSVRWQYLLIAFSMAVTLWYMVTVRDKIETWVDVRVEFKSAPPNLIIRNGLINKVSVRVRAAKGLSRTFTERPFSVAIDLSNLSKGTNTITITPAMLPFPSAFEVMDISPSRFQVVTDSVESRKVQLDSSFEGTLSGDFFVKSLRMTPSTATVRGPESLVQRMNSIKVPVALGNGTKAGLSEMLAPIPVPEGVTVEPEKVLLDLDVGVRTKTIRLARQVTVDVPSGRAVKIAPPRVTLEVAVPESQVGRQELLATIVATVTPPEGARGVLHLPVKVLLPENCSLASVTPKDVSVTLLD